MDIVLSAPKGAYYHVNAIGLFAPLKGGFEGEQGAYFTQLVFEQKPILIGLIVHLG